MSSTDRRSQVDKLIAQSKTAEARGELAMLWHEDPSSSAFVISRYKAIDASSQLRPCKVSIERSFTIEPLVPILKAGGLVAGINFNIRLSPYNAHVQEMLNPGSALYDFNADVVILAVLTSDVLPELWGRSPTLSESDVEKLSERVTKYFTSLIEAHKSNSSSYLIIHLLERPPFANAGILDSQLAHGQLSTIQLVNERLRLLARDHHGVLTLDYDALVSRVGLLNWRDEAKWQTVRLPIKAQFHRSVVEEWLRFFYPITGKTAKVVAVDLDNTIWGGVVGEDGVAGIKIGNEYPGTAFRAVQEALLDLRERGLLLAICSKNNREDALEVFETHPEMLLKLDHFSAVRINWENKAANLRSIASELNVGLDALALIDDNPIERQHVSSELPEVFVVDLPDSALHYPDAIRSFPAFERLKLSQEDKQRTASYAAQGLVSDLRLGSLTEEDFYRSLEQKVRIAPVDEFTITRAAQLTQKTNQFNLTSRRYSEQQIASLVARPDWRTYTIRVIDRYVDNGLVGLALIEDRRDEWVIDTFLLSCRVIGRGIETALLSFIGSNAKREDKIFLSGLYIPTTKNAPAKEFYRNHGFDLMEENSGVSHWRLDLETHEPSWPTWIELDSTEVLTR